MKNRLSILSAFTIGAGALVFTCAFNQAQSPPAGEPQAAPPQRQPHPEVAAGDAAFKKQDWNAAVEHYRKAIAVGIDHGVIQLRLGYSLHAMGRYEEALVSHLRTAAFPHPEIRIDGLYNAACAHAMLGNKDKALEFLAKAIDAGFKDVAQVSKDTDLNSLRGDEQFKKMIAGIGKSPRLCEQMNFLLGQWTQTARGGEVVVNLKITRPLPNSHALASESTNQGTIAMTGMLWPDSNERLWHWTEVDGLGTVRESTGKMNDDGSITFTGRDACPVSSDTGPIIRLTFTPQDDGRVREKCEVSEDDGCTWRQHHEEFYVKKVQQAVAADAETVTRKP